MAPKLKVRSKPRDLAEMRRNPDNIYARAAKYAEIHPGCTLNEIAKKVCRTSHTVTKKYLLHLESIGHKESADILDLLRKKPLALNEQDKIIRDGIEKYPDLSYNELAKKINIPSRNVYRFVTKTKSGKSNKKTRALLAPTAVRRRRLVKLFREHPDWTYTELGKELGIKQSIVMNDMKALSEQYRREAVDELGVVFKIISNELFDVVRECKDRLERIKQPTHGGHIMEVRLRALNDIAKLYHLTDPAQSVMIDVHITKEQKDACVVGAMQEMAIANDLNFSKMQIPFHKPASAQVVDVDHHDVGDADNG